MEGHGSKVKTTPHMQKVLGHTQGSSLDPSQYPEVYSLKGKCQSLLTAVERQLSAPFSAYSYSPCQHTHTVCRGTNPLPQESYLILAQFIYS